MAVWNAVAWLSLSASNFIVTALLWRMVGVTDFGIWATIAALKAFVLFLDGGLAFGITRDAARAETEGKPALRRVAAARFAYLVLGVFAIVLAVILADLPGAMLGLSESALTTSRTLMLLAGVETGVALAFSPLLGIVRGQSRFDVIAAVSVTQAAVVLGLLIVLAPSAGLPGAAVALLAGRVASAGVAYGWLRWTGARLLTWATGRAEIAAVIRFAAPLWIVAAGALIGLRADVPIVGAIHGPAAAGAYGVGATVPAIAVGLLFVLIDTAYPRLTTLAHEDIVALTRSLMLLGALLAGLGFTVLVLFGRELLAVWLGDPEALSFTVLAVYAVSFALNVPAHVLSLVAIARSHHALLAPVVVTEAAVSLLMSIALALTIGPVGPAIGTMVTLTISNVIVIPIVLLRKLSIPARPLIRSTLRGGGIGILAAVIIWAAVTLSALPAPMSLIVAVGLTAAVAGLLARAAIDPHMRRRAWFIARYGGWRVIKRERDERRAVTEALEAMRRETPTIWTPVEKPLVTVRIATYNRGAIVAERAIASALAQTYDHLEILVVGDACDAATEAAVRSVRDPRVRFENLARRGDYPESPFHRWMVAGSAPMNRALAIARGAWIAPLDDDDEFTPDHVEVLLDACRERELEFAYGKAEMETSPGEWEIVGSWPLAWGQIVHASVLYDSRLRIMPHSMDAWRLREPGDWNLWRRMRDAGVRMGFVDRVVCRHYYERRDAR